MNWNGYPPNAEEHGMHVIASRLGRHMTVYKWHYDLECWEDINARQVKYLDDMSDMTYIGSVKQ